ncbi:MAG: hypothetical protein HOW73_28555 [Polyangiaceae bacterium]|nr:hypothetical protein [Polyangiaceae bacterium]
MKSHQRRDVEKALDGIPVVHDDDEDDDDAITVVFVRSSAPCNERPSFRLGASAPGFGRRRL